MNYIELDCRISNELETASEILAAELSQIGFESFLDTEYGLKAYVQLKDYDKEAVEELLKQEIYQHFGIEFTTTEIEQQNWNDEWEKNYFDPIVIDDQCVVHSSFHTDIPSARYSILINPKMSFGTGHHETTSLMVSNMLEMDFAGKTVLDMGCGTGILGILASMKGAKQIMGIDIDEWVYDNVLENIGLNNIGNMEVKIGDATSIQGQYYDIILANIIRNVLLEDISKYSLCLHKGARLVLSGFYLEDLPLIRQEAEKNGLSYESHLEKNDWVGALFVKLA